MSWEIGIERDESQKEGDKEGLKLREWGFWRVPQYQYTKYIQVSYSVESDLIRSPIYAVILVYMSSKSKKKIKVKDLSRTRMKN